MHKDSGDASDTSLDELLLQYLEDNGETTVANLHKALSFTHPDLTKAKTSDTIWRLVNQRKLELNYPRVNAFVPFLGEWEMNLGIYVSFIFSLILLIVINFVAIGSPLVFLRWVLGSAFVVFFPGYVATEALFPKAAELDSTERLAVTMGLSLGLMLMLALFLNYSAWGIQATPIAISLTFMTIMFGAVALLRRYADSRRL